MIKLTESQLKTAASSGDFILDAYERWGGDPDVSPEQARAEIEAEADTQLSGAKAATASEIYRWVLFGAATSNQTREKLWWVIPEGQRFRYGETEFFEGEVMRARYPWDPPDLLEQLEAVGLIGADTAKGGKIQTLTAVAFLSPR